MKKALLFSAVAVLVLFSCAACRNNCPSAEPNATCKTGKNGPDSAVPFEYQGHKYIIFHSYGGFTATSYSCAVVHDPNCPCHQENDDASKKEIINY